MVTDDGLTAETHYLPYILIHYIDENKIISYNVPIFPRFLLNQFFSCSIFFKFYTNLVVNDDGLTTETHHLS